MKVKADPDPFPKAESHCVDARYYLKDEKISSHSDSEETYDKGKSLDSKSGFAGNGPFQVVIHIK